MKRVFILFLISVIFILYNNSCKKSSTKSVTQRIQGIWHINNTISNDHSSGVDHKDTVVGIPADVIDFRTDGKVYSFVQGTYDTSAYTIPTDTQIIVNINPFDIKTLTDNILVLYAKVTTGGSDYFEETENLKR